MDIRTSFVWAKYPCGVLISDNVLDVQIPYQDRIIGLIGFQWSPIDSYMISFDSDNFTKEIKSLFRIPENDDSIISIQFLLPIDKIQN